MEIMISQKLDRFDDDDFHTRSWIDEGLKILQNESYTGEGVKGEAQVNNNFHVLIFVNYQHCSVTYFKGLYWSEIYCNQSGDSFAVLPPSSI